MKNLEKYLNVFTSKDVTRLSLCFTKVKKVNEDKIQLTSTNGLVISIIQIDLETFAHFVFLQTGNPLPELEVDESILFFQNDKLRKKLERKFFESASYHSYPKVSNVIPDRKDWKQCKIYKSFDGKILAEIQKVLHIIGFNKKVKYQPILCANSSTLSLSFNYYDKPHENIDFAFIGIMSLRTIFDSIDKVEVQNYLDSFSNFSYSD